MSYLYFLCAMMKSMSYFNSSTAKFFYCFVFCRVQGEDKDDEDDIYGGTTDDEQEETTKKGTNT